MPRLEKLGVVEVNIGKPTNFLSVPPEEVLSELIERQKQIFDKQISELTEKKGC